MDFVWKTTFSTFPSSLCRLPDNPMGVIVVKKEGENYTKVPSGPCFTKFEITDLNA